MQHNKHPITGRASRAVDAVVVDGASARLAKLTRDAALLEADALHWSDRGNARFAIGCAREAAALRAEAKRLAEVKFTRRPKTKTVTFRRDRARLAKAPAVLRLHVEKLMTRNGWTRWVEAFQRIHGRALDDMTAVGRRRADSQSALTNRGARVH